MCWSIWKTLDVLSPSISLQELAAPQIRSSITGGVAKHHLLIRNLCSENTRISAGTEKHSMGGGVWEQTNLGGVKV